MPPSIVSGGLSRLESHTHQRIATFASEFARNWVVLETYAVVAIEPHGTKYVRNVASAVGLVVPGGGVEACSGPEGLEP